MDEGGDPTIGGRQAAAAQLRHLLSRDGRYREVWERRVDRREHTEGISQAAIARVLADELTISGCATDPRGLKDRVNRALDGRRLTNATLELFVSGFGITPGDAEQLRQLLTSDNRWLYLRGDWGSAPEIGLGGQKLLDIIWRHELHRLGAKGSPVSHRSIIVVKARQDGVRTYPCYFDTGAVRLQVVRGGRPGQITRLDDEVYRAEITLTRPLKHGETASIEIFYEMDYDAAPPPDFRLAAPNRVEHVQLDLCFDPAMLPKALFWSSWVALDGPPRQSEPVPLEADHSAHRYLELVESTIVGFTWEW